MYVAYVTGLFISPSTQEHPDSTPKAIVPANKGPPLSPGKQRNVPFPTVLAVPAPDWVFLINTKLPPVEVKERLLFESLEKEAKLDSYLPQQGI